MTLEIWPGDKALSKIYWRKN